MILFKKLSTGFLSFALLYFITMMMGPLLLDFLEMKANVNMNLFDLRLGKIVNNEAEMYGQMTVIGFIIFGLIGGIINSLFYFVWKKRKKNVDVRS